MFPPASRRSKPPTPLLDCSRRSPSNGTLNGMPAPVPASANGGTPGSGHAPPTLWVRGDRLWSTPRGVRAAVVLRLLLEGLSERTVDAYQRDLADFASFRNATTAPGAFEEFLRLPAGAAHVVALEYRAHLTHLGLAPATINRRLATLRAATKLARILGRIDWALEVPSVRWRPYRDTRGPGASVVRRMHEEAAREGGAKGARDRAVLRLLSDLGLRRAEVVGLDLADLDLERGTVHVTPKGGREKERLTLPAATHEALHGWLAFRGDSSGPLFTNFDRAGKGLRLTGTSVWRIVRALGAKVDATVRPHGLRHTAITTALEETRGDVRAAQRFSRHRSLQTLTIYDDNRRDDGGRVAALVARAYADEPSESEE